eukprot:3184372-Rhodomonas_salina.4
MQAIAAGEWKCGPRSVLHRANRVRADETNVLIQIQTPLPTRGLPTGLFARNCSCSWGSAFAMTSNTNAGRLGR